MHPVQYSSAYVENRLEMGDSTSLESGETLSGVDLDHDHRESARGNWSATLLVATPAAVRLRSLRLQATGTGTKLSSSLDRRLSLFRRCVRAVSQMCD